MAKFYLSWTASRGSKQRDKTSGKWDTLTSVKNVSSSLACTSLSSPLHLGTRKNKFGECKFSYTPRTRRSQGLEIL